MACILLTTAFSCGGSSNKPISTNVKNDELACTDDTDCTVVKEDCCGCNQGGRQRAIAEAFKTKYLEDKDLKCQQIMCTMMMSTDPSCSKKAACENAICVLK